MLFMTCSFQSGSSGGIDFMAQSALRTLRYEQNQVISYTLISAHPEGLDLPRLKAWSASYVSSSHALNVFHTPLLILALGSYFILL